MVLTSSTSLDILASVSGEPFKRSQFHTVTPSDPFNMVKCPLHVSSAFDTAREAPAGEHHNLCPIFTVLCYRSGLYPASSEHFALCQ